MSQEWISRRKFLTAVGTGASIAACSGLASKAFAEGETHAEGMPKRRLGRTNEMVSMLGLGGFHIGVQEDEKESIRIIRTAIERGVTFLDNCWDYNGGQSEVRMGKALQDGYRAKVFLMTKLDGRTKKSALGQLDQSLRRLKTDVIDLVQIHE